MAGRRAPTFSRGTRTRIRAQKQLPILSKLENKIVVVTGGSSGIGRALVNEALARGARVATCGRSHARLEAAFPSRPDRLMTVAADVTKREDCDAFIGAVAERWGGVDVLLANAGISMRALFADADVSVLEELMQVNFWGAVYPIKAALPLITARGGVVAGISSIAGYRGLPARTGYSASKFALQGFLEALRTELLHSGTHVMWVSPGFTASAIRTVARGADGTAQAESPLDEGSLMSAAECARRTLDAVEKRKRSLVMTRQGKLTVALSRWAPALLDKLVYRHFAREEGSPLGPTV